MGERSVEVKLVAHVDEYVSKMKEAAEATERFNDAAREAKRLRGEEV